VTITGKVKSFSETATGVSVVIETSPGPPQVTETIADVKPPWARTRLPNLLGKSVTVTIDGGGDVTEITASA